MENKRKNTTRKRTKRKYGWLIWNNNELCSRLKNIQTRPNKLGRHHTRKSFIRWCRQRTNRKTTKSDDEGNYEIYVIPGKYDFYAERQGFLADITTKITINENDEIDLGTKILYEGDADRSGIIDLNDTIEIVNSMGASKGDSTYSEKYDFGQKDMYH